MKRKKIDIIPTKPLVFDMTYVESVPAHQKETLRLYLSCDWNKARHGLTDQMWLPGNLEEASTRIKQFESVHGRAF